MRTTRTIGLAVSTLAATAILTACGGTGNQDHATMPAPASPPTTQAGSNPADVTFAQQMIPHHQQAVEMAKLVQGRTSNQRLIDLATQIQQAQGPEIQTMTEWLRKWGAPAPMPGMDHGSMGHTSMPGMMTPEDMGMLEQVTDAQFDARWLAMMIQHHQGAVDMAKTEQQNGVSAEATQLAQQIIDAQQAEITTMNGLLGTG